MMRKQYLEAGKIVGTHGVRGEIKVQSWCDSAEVLCEFDTLYLEDKTPVHIVRAQVHKNVVLLQIEGVDTMEKAQALRGKLLLIDRDQVELPENLVFIQDILGFCVFDRRTQSVVGKLREVLTSNPVHDLYEIQSESGKLFYVPASKPFLQQIDMEKGMIEIESIEGLLE